MRRAGAATRLFIQMSHFFMTEVIKPAELLSLKKKQQEMLHILTIAVRQIMHAFALAIKNSQILIFSRITFQNRRKIAVIIRVFPHLFFWKKSLWKLSLLHNKVM